METDRERFAPRWGAALRGAVGDLSWLLSRGYNERSALKLVGDRHCIDARQREAVRRCSCSDEALADRRRRHYRGDLAGHRVMIDAFNLLITLETALDGALVLRGRDGCLRDLAGVHGAYRARGGDLSPTLTAIRGVAAELLRRGAAEVAWLLDRPVSYSGELAALLREEGTPGWKVNLVDDPDLQIAAASSSVAATSDSGILDRCGPWTDLLTPVVQQLAPRAWIVDLSG